MSVPTRGRADFLQEGDWNAVCSVCGRKGKASEMYKIPIGLPGAGSWAHSYHEAYKRRQPQDLVRGVPDKMAAPWVQMGGGTTQAGTAGQTAGAGAVFVLPAINIGSADTEVAVPPDAEAIVTIPEGVDVNELTFMLGSGGPTSVQLNVFGSVGSIVTSTSNDPTLPSEVTITPQIFPGGGYRSMRFGVQPPAATLNTALSPAVTVEILNLAGSVDTSFTGNVTLVLGQNPTGATLSGTRTVAAVAGVATFSTLQLDRSGSGFTLVAFSTGLLSVQSATFSLLTQLVFTTQPQGGEPSEILETIVVTVQDSAGNTDINYNSDVSVALYTGAELGILDGFTTRLAYSGVAMFSGLFIADEGTYSLRATADPSGFAATPTAGISDPFEIIEFTHTLVAASFTEASGFPQYTGIGFFLGGSPNPAGSFTPNTINGATVFMIAAQLTHSDPPPPLPYFFIQIDTEQVQSFFTSITIEGYGTLNTASASSFVGAGDGFGVSQWSWDGINPFSGGAGSYNVTIT